MSGSRVIDVFTQVFTDTLTDTGAQMAASIAARAEEVHSTLRATGDSAAHHNRVAPFGLLHILHFAHSLDQRPSLGDGGPHVDPIQRLGIGRRRSRQSGQGGIHVDHVDRRVDGRAGPDAAEVGFLEVRVDPQFVERHDRWLKMRWRINPWALLLEALSNVTLWALAAAAAAWRLASRALACLPESFTTMYLITAS